LPIQKRRGSSSARFSSGCLYGEDLRRIDEAMPAGSAKGGRYLEAQLSGVYL
jgi:hypothetical protein